MQTYDIIMLAVLLVTIFLGYRRGLAWQIASLSAIFVSYFVAINFRDQVAEFLDAEPPWNTFLAMLILYAATSLCVWFAFQVIKGILNRAKLKDFDRQMGALFGALKGGLLCMVITFFAITLLGDAQKQKIISSRSGFLIAHALDRATMVMPKELSQVLGPYLKKLDESLDGQSSGPSSTIVDQFDRLDLFRENAAGEAGGRSADSDEDFPSLKEIFPAEESWPVYREESNAARDDFPTR